MYVYGFKGAITPQHYMKTATSKKWEVKVVGGCRCVDTFMWPRTFSSWSLIVASKSWELDALDGQLTRAASSFWWHHSKP